MKKYPYEPVLETTRGGTVESVHYGAVAVVEPTGKLVAHYGDPDGLVFMRSSAKPFQALPFIEAGGHEHFGLTAKEIALMCASHSGTDAHVETVLGIQEKVGITVNDLQCGAHSPYDKETTEALRVRGEAIDANRNNCSGKHSGMLAHAILKGYPTENYLDPEHPIQQRILLTFARLCDLEPEDVHVGTDGCSAPNFAVPLKNAALAWARLADPSGLPEKRADACRVITSAMMAHPDMVGGPKRFDTTLMQAARGKVVSKGGAEGYQGYGILPEAMGEGKPALGITLKIADGDGGSRAGGKVAVEVLRQIGPWDETIASAMKAFGPTGKVLNVVKKEVGEIRPVFELIKN